MAGSRQIFDLAVDAASSSCGSGVPIMTVDSIRGNDELEPFYAAMSDEELPRLLVAQERHQHRWAPDEDLRGLCVGPAGR